MDTEWSSADVDALAGQGGLRGFVVPKAEDPRTGVLAGHPVMAPVETAYGIHSRSRDRRVPGRDPADLRQIRAALLFLVERDNDRGRVLRAAVTPVYSIACFGVFAVWSEHVMSHRP